MEIRADEAAYALIPGELYTQTERRLGAKNIWIIFFLLKWFSSVEEAIAHINKYNTKHSEAIITNNYEHAQKFLDEVDAAAVLCQCLHTFLQMDLNSVSGQRSVSAHRSFMRGTYGTSGSDHNEIYHLWKRTGTPIDSTLIFSERCAILQFRFGITDCFVGNKKSDGVSSDFN